MEAGSESKVAIPYMMSNSSIVMMKIWCDVRWLTKNRLCAGRDFKDGTCLIFYACQA